MTDLKATMPTAVRRALELLADPPAEPDINAYLDLLDAGLPTGTPAAEMFYASAIGSRVYANMAPIMHRLFTLQPPMEWLNIPADVVALDVGCSPGRVTTTLARAVGPRGLALGVDISAAMLARAVRVEADHNSDSCVRMPNGCRCVTRRLTWSPRLQCCCWCPIQR
jgi:SAM-dependent methyltransferase